MIKFLAYGSLRKGEFNFDRFGTNSIKYIETKIIKGYKMYSLGFYPFLVFTGNQEHLVTCDILETSKPIFQAIVQMEEDAGYIETTEDGLPLFIMEFTNCSLLKRLPEIVSGDWKIKN